MKKTFFILFLTLTFLFFQKAGTTPVFNFDPSNIEITRDQIDLSVASAIGEMIRESLTLAYSRNESGNENELCDGTDDEENLDDEGNQELDQNGDPLIGDNYKSCPSSYANYAEYIAAVGYAQAAENEIDCRDNDPDINPGADEICDGKDNNCDGYIDNDDPNVYCSEIDHADDNKCADEDGDEIDCKETLCSDGLDKDNDDLKDCDDPDCSETDYCSESGLDEAATEAAGEDAADVDECSDGDDDDGDGLIDCKDDDCATDEACLEQDTECGNGLNDDGDLDSDGKDIIDCDDPDCAGSEACIETGSTECSNGKDDDDDGLEDCDDEDCTGETVCEPGNLDDDGDGYSENQGDDDDTNDKLWFTSGSLNEDNDGDGYSENEGDCDDTSKAFSPAADEICDDDNNRDENCDGQSLTHEDFGKSSSFDMSAVQYLEDEETGLKCLSAEYVPLAVVTSESPIPISCSLHVD